MFTTIYNTGIKNTKLNEEGLLVWSSIFTAEMLWWGTAISGLLYKKKFIIEKKLEYEVSLFKIIISISDIKQNPEELDTFYEIHTSILKKKHKTKEDLILLRKGEDYIKVYREVTIDTMKNFMKAMGVESLERFFEYKDEGIINLFYSIRASEKIRDVEYETPYIRECIKENDSFMLIEESQLSKLNDMEINKFDSADLPAEGLFGFSFPLFSFPPPSVLEYEQAVSIRESLLQKFNAIEKHLADINDIVLKKGFTYDNVIEVKDIVTGKMKEAVESFQNAADENLYFDMLKNCNESGLYHELRGCIMDLNSFLDMIREIDLIGGDVKPYVIEAMKAESECNHGTLFLYTKTYKL